jgi:hypothetical protein
MSSLEMALSSSNRDLLSALLDGGLLRKVKADVLLQYALVARRFSFSMRLAMMMKHSWGPLIAISGYAAPRQIRVMTERNPGDAMALVTSNLATHHEMNSWAALDAL